jgi:hypothetical protein
VENSTNFDKANTHPESICDAINTVYNLSPEERKKRGKQARKWATDNFSVRNVGRQVEKFLDESPLVEDYDFDFTPTPKRPEAKIEEGGSDKEFVKRLYKEILVCEVDDKDQGLGHWLERLGKDLDRGAVERYFRQIAAKENAENKRIDFKDLLDKDDEGKRILYVIPESIGDVFLSTAVINSVKKAYPEYNVYVATKPENAEVLKNNPDIHKVLPYIQQMDNQVLMEGFGESKGFFQLSFHGYLAAQRFLDYLHQGGEDRIQLDLNPKQ